MHIQIYTYIHRQEANVDTLDRKQGQYAYSDIDKYTQEIETGPGRDWKGGRRQET